MENGDEAWNVWSHEKPDQKSAAMIEEIEPSTCQVVSRFYLAPLFQFFKQSKVFFFFFFSPAFIDTSQAKG